MARRYPPLLILILLPLALAAHDTWLVPVTFRTDAGKPVVVRFATSEAFPTSDSPVGPGRIARFTFRTASGTQEVTGYKLEGNYLVASVTPTEAGHAVIVAETRPRAFVLEPKIFNDYIGHEELKHVIEARAAAGQSNAPGRERYRKIAKAILCVGNPRDSAFARTDGLWLEIIPERSPCGLEVGDALTVQVLFAGQPLAGAHLAAGYQGVTGHNYPVWILTDAQGRATVEFDRPGAWFVRTLHMVPTKNDAESDWESAFSTLTFEVLPRKTTGAPVEIRRVAEEQDAAWNRGDIEAFMQGYWRSDRLTFSSSGGVRRGWDAVLERYRRTYPDRNAMGKLSFSDLEITLLTPDFALVLGRWRLERERDRPGGVFTLVMKKFPEGWRILHDHTSSDPLPQVARP